MRAGPHNGPTGPGGGDERTGDRFVPPLNLANRDTLEYVLDMNSSSRSEFELYPTLEGKGAALAYHIISRHVFWEGNKRTGIFAAWEFLRINGVDIHLDNSVEDMARGVVGIRDMEEWLRDHRGG